MRLRTSLMFATGTAAIVFATCVQAQAPAASPAPLKVRSVEFTSTPAPSTPEQMAAPYSRSEAIVTLADGTKKKFPLTYKILHRSGDYVGGGYAALVVDKQGKPILEATDGKGNRARGPFEAAGADGTSMLVIPNAKVDGVKGHTVFLVNHIEYQTTGINVDPKKKPVRLYGRLPMAINLTVLDQDPKTGVLKPIKLSNVDLSDVQGVWIPCNSSPTPWRTHLGSEEYEPDARVFEKKPLEAMNRYLNTPGKTASQGGANAYNYGHIVEVKVAPTGATKVVKHFAMGRLAFELGDVMPDRRTVYFGDDGDDVILAMFVADKAEDLSRERSTQPNGFRRTGPTSAPPSCAGSNWVTPPMPRSRRSSPRASSSAIFGKPPSRLMSKPTRPNSRASNRSTCTPERAARRS